MTSHNLAHKAVEILAIEMATDLPSTFNQQSCMKMVSNTCIICMLVPIKNGVYPHCNKLHISDSNSIG